MKIRIASAPVSWGVIMKDTPNVPPWDRVLREISLAGYSGTELGPFGYLPQDSVLLRERLDELGLSLLAAYVQINLVDPAAKQDEYDETMATTRLLSQMGCEWVVLSDALFFDSNRARRAGRIRPQDGMSEDDWRRFISNAEDYGKRALEDYGLQAVFHPHVGAWIETEAEIDRLMNETDPRYVNLCLDTAHCMYGGGDPVAVGRRWSERLKYLHIKECDNRVLETVRNRGWDYFKAVELDVFPELGRGSVDFAGLLDLLRELDFDGWAVIEQDILPDRGLNPLDSAKGNLAHLHGLGYAESR
ncbi:MAG: sugar phosphate isomerase/epimerase [Chloroflexi bacterium]|nr:sugar phosphate isomerase/epimerase [Chloroflexota bacterium]